MTAGARSTDASVLVFDLGEVETGDLRAGAFGIEVTQVLQVIEPTSLSPVPLAPAVVLGIMNYHGRIVTVVDPSPILRGVPARRHGPEAQVIMLRQRRRSTGNVGLQVTRVREIIPPAGLEEVEIAAGACVGWVARAGRRLINVVQVEALLEGFARELDAHLARQPRQGVG